MKQDHFFKDKVAIITGASSGIGKELARQLLDMGASVLISGRNEERLHKTAEEFNKFRDNFTFFKGDASRIEDDERMVRHCLDHFGKIDILITNAGISGYGEIEKLKPELIKQVVDINIYGSIFPVMAALPYLSKNHGHILLVSSLAGLHGLPSYSGYSLSKMALTAFAQSLCIEQENRIYVGIAYIGFTENESTKRTLSPEGIEEEVPQRNKNFTSSRAVTASKMLRQIQDASPSRVYSVLGRITYILSRLFPGLLRLILKKQYKRTLRKD